MAQNHQIAVSLLLQAAGFNQGLNQANQGLHGLQNQAHSTDRAMERLSRGMGNLKTAAGALGLGILAKQLYDIGHAAVTAREDIVSLQGSINAIISANHELRDSGGALITGIEKIKTMGQVTGQVFRQLQIDALKTSDTTKGLIEKFSAALSPGLGAGMNLDQIRQLTVSASVAMSTLKVEAGQARSEIRALLTGDELDNAQLAQSLGFKSKAQITELRNSGKLFDEVMSRMADFKAAGEIQARTLTGVGSSLEDLAQKYAEVAGTRANEKLTEGFGELLDKIQEADGSLTTFGEELMQLGRLSGEVLGDMSTSFLDLVGLVLEGGTKIGGVLLDAYMGIKAVAAEASQNVEEGKATARVSNLKARVREAEEYDAGWYNAQKMGMSHDDFIKRAGERPLDSSQERSYRNEIKSIEEITLPGMKGASTDEITETLQRILGNDPNWKPIGKNGPKIKAKTFGGNKDGTKKDPRIKGVMTRMGRDLDLNKAKEGGLNGEIAILREYQAELKKLGTAAEEVADLEHRLTIAGIELWKKKRDLAAESTAALLKLEEQYTGQAQELMEKRLDGDVKAFKAVNAEQQAALEARYDAGRITAEEYYAEQERLRQEDVEKERAAEVQKLTAHRANVKARLDTAKGRSGAAYDAVEVARLEGDLNQADLSLTQVNTEADQAIVGITQDSKTRLTNHFKETAANGLRMGLEAVMSGDLDGMQTAFRQSMIGALVGAFKDSKVSESIGKALSGGQASGPGADLITLSALGFADATWNRLTLGDRMMAGGKEADKIFKDAMDGGPDAIASKYKGIREQIEKARTVGDRVFGMDFNVQKGGLTPEEEERLKTAEGEERRLLEARKNDGMRSKWIARGQMTARGELALLDGALATEKNLERREELLDRYFQYQKQSAADAEQDWREQMKATEGRHKAMVQAMAGDLRRLKDERDKSLADRRQADNLGSIYGTQSAANAKVNDLRRKLAAARADIDDAAKVAGGANRVQDELFGKFGASGGRFPVNVRSKNGKQVQDPDTGKVIADGDGWQWGAEMGTFAEDMATFAKWAGMGNLEVTDSAGRALTPDALLAIMQQWTAAQEAKGDANTQSAAARKAEAELIKELDQVSAAIKVEARQAAGDLEVEADLLEGQVDPAKARAARLQEIDAKIKARRDYFVQAGLLGPSANPEDAAKIQGNLDRIAELMRQQVDADNQISEANPLPVKVVELPKVFALPSSYYFRDRDPARLSIGKLEINGSGLDEAALQRATQQAIVGASYDITNGVNRENVFRGSQLTV